MGFVSIGRKIGTGVCRENSASALWRVPAAGASLNSYGGRGGGVGVWNLGESGHNVGDGGVHMYHTEAEVSRSDGVGSNLYSLRWRVRNGEVGDTVKPAAAQAAVRSDSASVGELSCFGNVLRRGGGSLITNAPPANLGIRDRAEIASVRRILDATAAGRLFHRRGPEFEPQRVSLGFAAQARGESLLVHVRGLSTCSHFSAGIELNGPVFEPQNGRLSLLPPPPPTAAAAAAAAVATFSSTTNARATASFSSSTTATTAAAAGGGSSGVTATRQAARSTLELARSDSSDPREDSKNWTARDDHGGEGGSAMEKREAAAVEEVHRVSEWAAEPTKATRPDGTPWPWRSFSPKDAVRYDSHLPESELTRHHEPENFGDKFAYYLVKSLRMPTDLFFRKKYGCRAVMLETVAAVPGMVGGMLLHLQSLRRFEHSGGWIRTLISEAENERMHLMTFMEVSKPKVWERALVIITQGVFANAFFVLYMISPRIAHRVVGYLEEEAVVSYTRYLEEIDAGRTENIPAPQIAIDYWGLPRDARLRDVVLAVRADEAHHRDVNHFASDIKKAGKELKDVAAPVDHDT